MESAKHRANRRGGRGKVHPEDCCRPNGLTVHPQDASTRERTGGAPLAAMHKQLTLSVCKRRDAVRLAQHEPARPAGAAFGVLSGATVSWAAPKHKCTPYPPRSLGVRPLGKRYLWQNLSAEAA